MKEIRIAKGTKKGFTLVELLVVITIIGVLAAIAIPKFGATTKSADIASFKSNYRIIIQAMQVYYANTGKAPTSREDINQYLPDDLQIGTNNMVKARPENATYVIEANGKFTATWDDEEFKKANDGKTTKTYDLIENSATEATPAPEAK